MSRFLLATVSIFVLLVTTFFLPKSVSASRCGEKMPVTFLSLYRSSEFIYVGTFDKVEEGEVTEDTAEYSVIPIKKSFSLSTALKGETKKMLVLEESSYRYKGRQVVEEAEVEAQGESTEEAVAEATEPEESMAAEVEGEEESEADDTELKPGDRVLLFLNKSEDGDDLELADYSDGLKKMTPEKLSAYEPRIRELNDIFSKAEPSYSEIVAWIVRCVEDPETRWEGTYELVQSFQYMEWNAERAKLAQQKSKTEEEEVDSERYLPQAPKKFDTGDENFAKELTEGQKLLLTNIMLNRERPKPKRTFSTEDPPPGMNRGDRELIELVRRWGDSKVAINILDQLRFDPSDPDMNADLMNSVATILDDEKITELAEQYSEIRWRSEEDEMEAEDAEGGVKQPEVVDQSKTSGTAETVNVPDEEFAGEFADETVSGNSRNATEERTKKEDVWRAPN